MGHATSSFGPLDWLVLIGYFVICMVLGLWVSRRVRTSGSYFLGDRKLPWWIMIAQSFGTGTHAENPVAQTGATFQFGFATIWYQWKNMLITPFYWLMAPWYRRSARTTIGEIIEDRYGRPLGLVYTLFALAFFVFSQGAMLKGAGKIISQATGGQLVTPNQVVVWMTAAFIAYSFLGGLLAAAYTDCFQGFLIIVLSFMLIPAGLTAIGGVRGMRETLTDERVAEYARQVEAAHPEAIIPGNNKGTRGFFDLYNDVSGIDLFTLLMLTLNGLIGITAQPHILTMNATGRSERAGRIGQTYGSLVKRFCTIGWAFTGLIVAALVIQQRACLADTESAFGYACLRLLAPGMTGLMVACVLAANMSACSNFMVNTGALFAHNLYQHFFHSTGSDREMLWVGRLSGLLLTGLGVVFALTVRQVLDAFMFTETIAALMGIMFLGGILWKRANRYGAAAGTLAAFLVYYGMNFLQTGKLLLVYRWTAVPYAWATLAGFACFIVFSLATAPEDPQRIERFFDKMRRTSDKEGRPEGHPLPPAAECGQDLLLLDVTGWFSAGRWRGFFRRYREDLAGFALAWSVVGLLVLIAWGCMQIAK